MLPLGNSTVSQTIWNKICPILSFFPKIFLTLSNAWRLKKSNKQQKSEKRQDYLDFISSFLSIIAPQVLEHFPFLFAEAFPFLISFSHNFFPNFTKIRVVPCSILLLHSPAVPDPCLENNRKKGKKVLKKSKKEAFHFWDPFFSLSLSEVVVVKCQKIIFVLVLLSSSSFPDTGKKINIVSAWAEIQFTERPCLRLYSICSRVMIVQYSLWQILLICAKKTRTVDK